MICSFGVSIAGPYHIDNGLPCQDANYILRACDDLFTIAACADGLGSELYSGIGASIAAVESVSYCAMHLERNLCAESIQGIIRDAMMYAYNAVLLRVQEDGNCENQYDTTLSLAVYNAETGELCYGHAGDSAIVALFDTGDYMPLTEQHRTETGEVFPLCFPQLWEFGAVCGVCSVMLTTDGFYAHICPPVLQHQPVRVNVPLAEKFMNRNDCPPETLEHLEEQVRDYLVHFPRESLDDDKTIVLLINTDRIPVRKDPDYYQPPNWNQLREETIKELYGENA